MTKPKRQPPINIAGMTAAEKLLYLIKGQLSLQATKEDLYTWFRGPGATLIARLPPTYQPLAMKAIKARLLKIRRATWAPPKPRKDRIRDPNVPPPKRGRPPKVRHD